MINPLNHPLFGRDGSKIRSHANLRKALLSATALVALSVSMVILPVDKADAQTELFIIQLQENVESLVGDGTIVTGNPAVVGSNGADTLTVNTGPIGSTLNGPRGVAIEFSDGDDTLTVNMNNQAGNRLVLIGNVIGGADDDRIIFNVGADADVTFRGSTLASPASTVIGVLNIEAIDLSFSGDNPTLTLSSPVFPALSASTPLSRSGSGTIRRIIDQDSSIISGSMAALVVESQALVNSTGTIANFYETTSGSSIYQNNGQSAVSIMSNGHFSHRGTIVSDGAAAIQAQDSATIALINSGGVLATLTASNSAAIVVGDDSSIFAMGGGAGSIQAAGASGIRGGDRVVVNIVGESPANPFAVESSVDGASGSGIQLGEQARVSAQNFTIDAVGGSPIVLGIGGSIVAEAGSLSGVGYGILAAAGADISLTNVGFIIVDSLDPFSALGPSTAIDTGDNANVMISQSTLNAGLSAGTVSTFQIVNSSISSQSNALRSGDNATVMVMGSQLNGGSMTEEAIDIGSNSQLIISSGSTIRGLGGVRIGDSASILVTGNSTIDGGSGTAVILGSTSIVTAGSSSLQIDEGSSLYSAGMLIAGGAGNDTIIVDGAIMNPSAAATSTAIDLMGGDDTIALNLASPSMIQGTVSGGLGTDRATFTHNGDSRATIAFDGFESVTKRGRGTLIQTTNNGATLADLVIEEGGYLLGAGASLSINNVITLNRDDAVFGGIGTVSSTGGTTINGGILSPGLSVGTITFMGGLTISPTTRLALDLDPANSDPLMRADLITVTGGNLVLNDNPVTLNYQSVPDTGTTSLTILAVDSGNMITGTLGAIAYDYTGPATNVILDPSVVFDSGQILIRTEALAPSDARVTPESYASAMAALSRIQSQSVFDSIEENRPNVQGEPGLGVWTDGFYANVQRDGNNNRNRGYKADFYGALVGMDAIVTDEVGIGGFVGYSGGDYTARNDLSGNQNYDAFVFGGYSRYQNDYLRADAIISYSTGDVDATRRANAATYEASYGLDILSVGGRLGVPLFRGSPLSVEPNVVIQYINTSRSQFSERITSQNPSSAANNFRLDTVFSQNYEELLMGAGVRLEYHVEGSKLSSIRGIFDIGWQEEVLSNRPEVVASTGGNQRFVSSASAANGGALGIAAGVAVGVTDQLSLWVNYDGRYDFSNYQQHGVSAGLSYRF